MRILLFLLVSLPIELGSVPRTEPSSHLRRRAVPAREAYSFRISHKFRHRRNFTLADALMRRRAPTANTWVAPCESCFFFWHHSPLNRVPRPRNPVHIFAADGGSLLTDGKAGDIRQRRIFGWRRHLRPHFLAASLWGCSFLCVWRRHSFF